MDDIKITENTDKLSKLKKKQKDVIQVDKFHDRPLKEETTNQTNTDEIKKDDDGIKIIQSVQDSTDNNSTLNKILFKLQLLLCMTNKVDEKITQILSQLLSEDHLKCILEERDCRGICGNILCGAKLQINKNTKKIFYNNSVKDFRKENALDFFCDVRCFQKFIDLTMIAQKFDFFRLLNIETIFVLSILCDYYPKNKYLGEIAALSKTMLYKELSFNANPQHFSNIREKYDKYFSEESNKEISEDNKSDDIGIDKIFN